MSDRQPGAGGTGYSEPSPAGPPVPGVSITSGSSALFLSQVVGNAGLFVGVLLVARLLGPDGRGAVAFITVSALVLGHLVQLGVGEATMVFAAQRPGSRPQLLANVVLSALIASIIAATLSCGFFLAVPAARPDQISVPELLTMAPAIVAAGLLQAGIYFLVGCSRFRQQALISASAPWLYPILVGLIAWTWGLSVVGAILAWAAAIGAWAVGLVAAGLPRVGLARPSIRLLAESIRFGAPAWAGSLARFLNFRADQILMGFIASQAALGFYSVAVNGAELLFYLPTAAAIAMLPVIARTQEGDRAARTLHVYRGLLVFTCAGVVIAALLGPVLIPLAFGQQFRSSVVPFLLLLPGAFGYLTMGIFSSALIASSSPGLSSVGGLVALPVGIVLDLALIPSYGASGAALASSIAFLAGGLGALLSYRVRIPFELRALIPRRTDVLALGTAAERLVRSR